MDTMYMYKVMFGCYTHLYGAWPHVVVHELDN